MSKSLLIRSEKVSSVIYQQTYKVTFPKLKTSFQSCEHFLGKRVHLTFEASIRHRLHLWNSVYKKLNRSTRGLWLEQKKGSVKEGQSKLIAGCRATLFSFLHKWTCSLVPFVTTVPLGFRFWAIERPPLLVQDTMWSWPPPPLLFLWIQPFLSLNKTRVKNIFSRSQSLNLRRGGFMKRFQLAVE